MLSSSKFDKVDNTVARMLDDIEITLESPF